MFLFGESENFREKKPSMLSGNYRCYSQSSEFPFAAERRKTIIPLALLSGFAVLICAFKLDDIYAFSQATLTERLTTR